MISRPIGLSYSQQRSDPSVLRSLLRDKENGGNSAKILMIFSGKSNAKFTARAEGWTAGAGKVLQLPNWAIEAPAAGASPPGNLSIVARVAGSVNRQALRRALADVVEQHEILRTLDIDDGELRVLEGPPEDVLQVQSTTDERKLEDVRRFTNRRIDWGREIPIRGCLFTITNTEHLLVIVASKAALDAWSCEMIIDEVSRCYRAREQEAEPPRPDSCLSYAEYIEQRQRALMDLDNPSTLIGRQFQYWTGMYRDLPVNPMPADPSFTRPEAWARMPIRLNSAVHGKVLAAAREAKVSSFMVLHAALVGWLAGAGMGQEWPIGTVSPGRAKRQWKRTMGPLAMPLLLRVDAAGAGSFGEILRRVRDVDIQALAAQEVPYAVLRSRLGNGWRSPTPFPVSLSVRTWSSTFDLPQCESQVLPVWMPWEPCELAFDWIEFGATGAGPGGMEGKLRYANRKYSASRIDDLWHDFHAYLEACMAPAVKVSPSGSTGPARRKVPRPYAKARMVIDHQLVQLWEEILHLHRIGIHDRFEDLQGSDEHARRIVDRLRREWSATCEESWLTAETTVEELMGRVCRALPEERVICVRKGDARKRAPLMFLLGDLSGGGLFWLRKLLAGTDEDQPVLALQPHGVLGGPVPDSCVEMAADFARQLKAHFPQGPYVLGGYCNGALIAQELAGVLERDGQRVAGLFLIDIPVAVLPGAVGCQPGIDQIVAASGPRDRAAALSGRYTDLVATHIPTPCLAEGLFVVSEAYARSRPRLTENWSPFVGGAVEVPISGDHVTCLGLYSAQIAQCLKDLLDRVAPVGEPSEMDLPTLPGGLARFPVLSEEPHEAAF